MELDRKVREFPIPPDAAAMQEELESPPDTEPAPLQESMIRFVLAHSREVSEYLLPAVSLQPPGYSQSPSSPLLAPQLLCAGYHRLPTESAAERICTLVPGCLSVLGNHPEGHPGSVPTTSEHVLSLLGHLDICVLCVGEHILRPPVFSV